MDQIYFYVYSAIDCKKWLNFPKKINLRASKLVKLVSIVLSNNHPTELKVIIIIIFN